MATEIEIFGEDAVFLIDDSDACLCPDGDLSLFIPIGVQGDPGLVTLAMFSAFMVQYLNALPRFRSVEVATGAPNNLVPGTAFIWANDTDVGIPGGLTTVPIP